MNNPNGITIHACKYGVKETIDRLQASLTAKGVKIYARINQQDELQQVGQTIPPLEFILFGNPKAGGPVMAESPVAALDLPLKIVAWEDEQKKVWLAYNEAGYVQRRFSLSDAVVRPLHLEGLVAEVVL
ncbi:DUF302 domain-containing protein [Chitinophaga agrisoli]|nr:DUF302 domain-containing protein [Chitinophaga agrisoli]